MNADEFWTYAMKSAYFPLNAIERCALIDLLQQDVEADQEDRWWAAMPELREDGAAVVVPLFLDRVDQLAQDYWDGRRVPSFSVKP